ncbi:acyl carrier protein [Pendulispora rubella]|uniref:Acyl carrier protein n=1 Tax=Pendulispora rubella TaxID=2741070 RepID=A0ABZ2KWP2_9BACT
MVAKERIQRLFDAAEIQVSASTLDESAPLAQQGLDSLDMANLLFQIEQACKSTIAPEESARLRTLGDITGYIERAQSAGAWHE